MKIEIIIWLLFAHWVADFVFQSDFVAQNKSKSNKVLIGHCLIYGGTIGSIMNFIHMSWFWVPVMLLHFPVDYITSRINSKLWADKKVHWFFVSVGFDQFIHFVTLIVCWRFLCQ